MTDESSREGIAEREITITRVFDAPRELVWKAWTEPEQLARWWGPRGYTTPLSKLEMDVRPGGVFRATMVSDADGSEIPSSGFFREVVEPERLVFYEPGTSECHDDIDDTVAVITFKDLGEGRTELVAHVTMLTTEDVPEQAEAGWNSSFDRLVEHLAQA